MAANSDNEEGFVSYGTPLEPLEEDEPLKKPVPIYEQTVVDEKGRYQRFHGAFTGGFSAGYFNTVGSKEGWTPSTFKSSRQSKAEKQNARPEDFMDEEDFGEHGIAPREITRSKEFSSGRADEARDKARAVNAQASLIPGDTLLEEIITPATSSIGVELLKTMGWKEGQGVGPRVKRKPRKQKTESGLRKYGCALPPTGSEGSEEEEDDDEFAPENVTFAPKDVTPFDFTPRLGLQGLGYRGLDPGMALLGRGSEHINLFDPQGNSKEQLFRDKQKHSRHRGVAGQAFGVGALEDEDEDIYHRDSMSKYDIEIREEEPGDGLYGWTAPQEYTQKKKDQNNDASYIGKILEGFTLAKNVEAEKKIFPPPTLPRDYRPVRRLHPGTFVSHLTGVSPALAEALKKSQGHMVKEEPQIGRHQLDSDQRRALLGEDSLQGPSSVMDLLRPEDRERLQKLRNSNSLQPPKSSISQDAPQLSASTSTSSSKSTPSSVTPPSLHQQQQQEALSAWRGQTTTQTFRPFEKNPEKQERYENYLSRLKQGDKDALEQSLDTEMTEWERGRERDEFVRASILYRPTSSSLSSRFTRGKHQDDDDTVDVNRDEEGDVDDKQAAVQMKMFGKLTRETFEWHPDKVLCKRFNVPDPYQGSGLVGLPKVKRDKFSVFNFLTVPESREASAPPPKPAESVKKSRWDVSEKNQTDPLSEMLSAARSQASETQSDQTTTPELPALPAPGSTDDQHEDTQTQAKVSKEPSNKEKKDESSDEDSDSEEEEEEEEESRPPMDVFKAIFSSSSDEKSSSESENEEEPKDRHDQTHITHNLFNISSTIAMTAPSVTTATTTVKTTAVVPQTNTQEEFGPKLPPPSSAFTKRGPASSPSSEDKPRKSKDKKHKNKKEHKHKKEKKRKKHKKLKHKAKQKKSKRDDSSSDSDKDSEGNTAEVSTEDLLKRLKTIRSHPCPL